MNGVVFWRIWLCGFYALLWTGCGSVPGSLRPLSSAQSEVRAAEKGRASNETLADYLEIIAGNPESVSAKKAGGRFVQLYRKMSLSRTAKLDRWNVRFTGDWPLEYFDAYL